MTRVSVMEVCQAYENAAVSLADVYLTCFSEALVSVLREDHVERVVFPSSVNIGSHKGVRGYIPYPESAHYDKEGNDVTVQDTFIDAFEPFSNVWPLIEKHVCQGVSRLSAEFPSGIVLGDAAQLLPVLLGPERSTMYVRRLLEEVVPMQDAAQAYVTRRLRL